MGTRSIEQLKGYIYIVLLYYSNGRLARALERLSSGEELFYT